MLFLVCTQNCDFQKKKKVAKEVENPEKQKQQKNLEEQEDVEEIKFSQ